MAECAKHCRIGVFLFSDSNERLQTLCHFPVQNTDDSRIIFFQPKQIRSDKYGADCTILLIMTDHGHRLTEDIIQPHFAGNIRKLNMGVFLKAGNQFRCFFIPVSVILRIQRAIGNRRNCRIDQLPSQFQQVILWIHIFLPLFSGKSKL